MPVEWLSVRPIHSTIRLGLSETCTQRSIDVWERTSLILIFYFKGGRRCQCWQTTAHSPSTFDSPRMTTLLLTATWTCPLWDVCSWTRTQGKHHMAITWSPCNLYIAITWSPYNLYMAITWSLQLFQSHCCFFNFLCQTVRCVFPGKLQNNTSTNDLLTSVLSQESCTKEIEVACTMYINHFVFICRNRTMQESQSLFFISFFIHTNFKNIPSCLGQHECLNQTAVLLSL